MLKGVKDTLARFTKSAKKSDDFSAELLPVVEQIAEGMADQAEQQASTNKDVADLKKQFSKFETEQKALQDKFKTIDTTDAGKHTIRPKASGGGDAQLTDC